MRILTLATATLALLIGAGPAAAATKTVGFDDLAPNTRVSNEYQSSQGITFPADPGSRPLVKTYPGKAHSGDRVGVYSCEGLPGCGEGFANPQLRAALTTSATSVSAFVGYWENPAFPNPGDTFKVRLRAFNSDDALVGESAYVTVTSAAPLTQQVSVTAPPGQRIDYFDVIGDAGDGSAGKLLAIDDVSVTTPDAPLPPDFTLNSGDTVVDVLTGTSVDVPVDLNRINGSNGDVSFSATGLPTGMTASFDPNPLGGTGTHATLRLAAAEGAAHSDQYTEITITATPAAGAGDRARTITKQVRIRENCTRTLRADYLDARSDDCLVRRGNQYEATNATVRVNGLVIKPADDSRPTLVIDPQNKTVKGRELTMPFRVAVDSDPDIPIYAGPISWDFSSGQDDKPRSVASFDISGVTKLKGLPLQAADLSFLKSGKATVKPTVRLGFWPFNYFGSITTSATFTTDNDHGADFTGMTLKVAKVNALALELKDVELTWQAGDTWSGGAKVVLRFGRTYEIGAGFGIKNGDFDFIRGSVGGLNQPIGTGVFLQSIGFEVQRSPLALIGSIGLSAGPQVAGVKAVTVGGQLKAVLADPWVAEITGNAKVADRFQLAKAFVRYSSTGLFEFGANADWSFWRLGLHGDVEGWVDGLDAFNVEGSLRACLDVWGPDPCGSAKALLSSRGIAGCVGVYGYYVGAGATWHFDFDAFTGCDLTPYREVKPARVRAAGAALRHTVLPKGLPSAAWEVTADGGPTGVTLTGPGGDSVTVSRDKPVVQNDKFYAQLREDGTTFVLADKPEAGRWTLTDDGTAPVRLVREGRGLPDPSPRAVVRGHGRSRVLSWKLKPISGQRVTFAEVGKDVRNAIKTTNAPKGSVRFRPADGPAGKRRIIAMVQQGGRPRRNQTAGSYRAPGMPRPGKPRKLKITRRGTRLVVSWQPNPRGFRHAVHVVFSDGTMRTDIVAARSRTFTLRGVPRSVGATVRVTGLTRLNSKGPSARASIRRARR